MRTILSWQEIIGEQYLYHGTQQKALERILRDGGIIKAPSYWGTQEAAEYYAEGYNVYGLHRTNFIGQDDEAVLIQVPLVRFDKSKLFPDQNTIAEPIMSVYNDELDYEEVTEEELYEQWEACKGTWQDCLRIYQAVVYKAPMRITEDDVR